MFGWGVLKRVIPELVGFSHWQRPNVHIFDTDPKFYLSMLLSEKCTQRSIIDDHGVRSVN